MYSCDDFEPWCSSSSWILMMASIGPEFWV